LPVAPNWLAKVPAPDRPDQIWASDITYIDIGKIANKRQNVNLLGLFQLKETSRPPQSKEGLDMLAGEFFEDPYPFYAYLRHHEPVHRTKQGCLLLTRHADILRALKHPLLGSAPADFATTHPRNRHRFVCSDVASNLLPFMDGPDYVLARQYIGPVLRKTFEEHPPDTDAAAGEILPQLLEQGAFDVLNDFGRPLSLRIICGFMDLSPDESADLYRWTDNFFRLFSPLPKAEERVQIDRELTEFRGYFRGVIESRKSTLGKDLVSSLMLRQIDGRRMNEEQVIDSCMLIFADAIENVDTAIAAAVLALHMHPGELRRLRKDPDLMSEAVEEALRYDAPGQTAPRIIREDCDLFGTPVRRNEVVLLGLGSANRDASVFTDPDRFVLKRPKRDHLAFGKGNHSCLGFFLVRSEMKAALSSLLAGTKKIEVHTDNLTWDHRPGHRWLKSLNVTVTPK
jgi:cytochrome P450